MTSKLLQVFLTQFLFIKVMASYMQPYSQIPYIVREAPQIPQKPYTTERAYHQQSYPQSYPPNYPHTAYKTSEPVVVQIVNPSRAPDVPNFKAVPTPTNIEIPNKCPDNLDSHVLNNLAIALQLLIVNNIINKPPTEPGQLVSPLQEAMLEMAIPLNSNLNVQDHEVSFPLPNSKFLGSSNFGNDVTSKAITGVGPLGAHSSPYSRSGVNLMSPYDAIASSVPLSEALTSSYLSKKDFQSPYAAILAADVNRDLFSMDFF